MAKKVLIVEDNELNMKLFHDLLDAQGYETLQTREGLEALSIARAGKAQCIPSVLVCCARELLDGPNLGSIAVIQQHVNELGPFGL